MLDKSGTAQVFYFNVCCGKVEWLVVHSGSNYFVLSVSFIVSFYVVGTPWSSNVLAMCNVLRKAASPATPAFAD